MSLKNCEYRDTLKTLRKFLFYRNLRKLFKAGDFGGNVTISLLEVDIKAEHHGSMFVCEAKNEALGQSVHNAMTISVNCELRVSAWEFGIHPCGKVGGEREKRKGLLLWGPLSVRASMKDVENCPKRASDEAPYLWIIWALMAAKDWLNTIRRAYLFMCTPFGSVPTKGKAKSQELS